MRASSFTLSDFLSGLGQGDPACVYRHGHSTALARSACFIRLELGTIAIGPERGRTTIIQEIHREYAVVLEQSEESRVRKEFVSKCSSWWSLYDIKKK